MASKRNEEVGTTEDQEGQVIYGYIAFNKIEFALSRMDKQQLLTEKLKLLRKKMEKALGIS